MKHVIFIRHATAAPEKFPMKDFDRKLEPEGLLEAASLGVFMSAQMVKPEFMLVSPAGRTLQTATIVAEYLHLPAGKIQQERKLYNAHFLTVIELIQFFDNQYNSIAIVAPNPGISQSGSILSSGSGFQMAPASARCLAFNTVEWAEVKSSGGKEIWNFNP
jgi:phosphohistidine phosphatase